MERSGVYFLAYIQTSMSSPRRSKIRPRKPVVRLTEERIQAGIEKAWDEFSDTLGERKRGDGRVPLKTDAGFVLRQSLELIEPCLGYGTQAEKYFTNENYKKAYNMLEKFYKQRGILATGYKKLKFSRSRPTGKRKSTPTKRSKSSSRKRSGNCPRPCPAGKVCNRASRRCVKKGGRVGKAVGAGRSPPKKRVKSRSPRRGCPRPCPADKVCNETTRRCVKRAGRVGKHLG
jgi:hypothetical protein